MSPTNTSSVLAYMHIYLFKNIVATFALKNPITTFSYTTALATDSSPNLFTA